MVPRATHATPDYIERIQAYMAKALKEAKLKTSWIQPNEAWDNGDAGISWRRFWIAEKQICAASCFPWSRKSRGSARSIRSRRSCSN